MTVHIAIILPRFLDFLGGIGGSKSRGLWQELEWLGPDSVFGQHLEYLLLSFIEFKIHRYVDTKDIFKVDRLKKGMVFDLIQTLGA